MTKTISNLGMVIVIFALFSCKTGNQTECCKLPCMPMTAIYEHSLEYAWSQKEVFESKLLSDMETMGAWVHRGAYGSLALSDEKAQQGRHSLLIESPTKGPEPPRGGRPWGNAGAFLNVDNEDWTDWNRITFWIYPDLPGFKLVSINTILYNEGETRIPNMNGKLGVNFQMLENQKWNMVT